MERQTSLRPEGLVSRRMDNAMAWLHVSIVQAKANPKKFANKKGKSDDNSLAFDVREALAMLARVQLRIGFAIHFRLVIIFMFIGENNSKCQT